MQAPFPENRVVRPESPAALCRRRCMGNDAIRGREVMHPLDIADIVSRKDQLRTSFLSAGGRSPALPPEGAQGKAAERLRHLPRYREAQSVMISPVSSLYQVRLNALTDRKRLVMPTPGLHKGFVVVEPGFIPPRQRHSAVQPGPENPFATRMPYREPPGFLIDLIVTEGLMVGRDGGRLGDGSGHLDLQCAILSSLGWLHPAFEVVGLVEDCRVVPSVPMKPGDVEIHWIVTPSRMERTPATAQARIGIQWDRLSLKQIKRNDALFFLYRARS